MATGGNTTQTPTDLETKAHDFLFSDELVKKNEALAASFDLSEKAQDDLANAQNAVVFKEIKVPEFIDTVKRIAVLSKKPSAELVAAVGESFLFPLNEYFGGEPKRLLARVPASSTKEEPPSVNLKAETWKLKASSVDPRALKIADAVIAEIGLGDKNLENKLREIIVARVGGVKDDLETKSMLKRSIGTGGVGVEDSLA